MDTKDVVYYRLDRAPDLGLFALKTTAEMFDELISKGVLYKVTYESGGFALVYAFNVAGYSMFNNFKASSTEPVVDCVQLDWESVTLNTHVNTHVKGVYCAVSLPERTRKVMITHMGTSLSDSYDKIYDLLWLIDQSSFDGTKYKITPVEAYKPSNMFKVGTAMNDRVSKYLATRSILVNDSKNCLIVSNDVKEYYWRELDKPYKMDYELGLLDVTDNMSLVGIVSKTGVLIEIGKMKLYDYLYLIATNSL